MKLSTSKQEENGEDEAKRKVRDGHRQTQTDTDRHRQTQTDTDRQRDKNRFPSYPIEYRIREFHMFIPGVVGLEIHVSDALRVYGEKT